MTTTLTIKQVPKQLADRLRRRAASNRRSLQRELLLIVEQAAGGDAAMSIAEPVPAVYGSQTAADRKLAGKVRAGKKAAGRLSLEELWERARKLGSGTPSESTSIIRRDRDAHHGR